MQVQAGSSCPPYVAQVATWRSQSTEQDTSSAGQATALSGVERYNFSSMSPAQMREAVNGLIRNGAMSLDESSSLLAIMAPPSARLRVDGSHLSEAEGAKIDSTPVDAFSLLRDGVAGARSRHDADQEARLSATIAALERIQGTTSSVDIRA